MEILDNEKILHVAKLANIKVDDVDVYKKQLNDILTEIKKIEDVCMDNDIMITSCTNTNCYKSEEEVMDKREDLLKNSKLKNGDFIVVPKALND